MNKTSKVFTIFAVGVAVGCFLNSSKRDDVVRAIKRQISKWRNKDSYYQEERARRYYLADDPIDEIAR